MPECCEGQTGESGLTGPQKKKQVEGGSLPERDRIETPCIREDFSFSNYLSYSVYSPLYLAGPIMTFNDYICQVCVLSIDFISLKNSAYRFSFGTHFLQPIWHALCAMVFVY